MRLLYAEDETSLARAVSTILTRNNYAVDVVSDGESALDYLATGNYDGAILDVMMPKLDGIEVLRRMRARGDSTPVLLLTAKAEIDDRVTGLDSGANDYLTKPFDMKELLARIRAMTRVLRLRRLRAERAGRQLQAGRQGVSDDGNADAKPPAAHLHRDLHGPHLGL